MSFVQPWLLTPSEFSSLALFHGSIEPWFDPVPRPGGYDKVFWTAEDPLTAQIYIPDWHGKTIFGFSSYRLDEQVTPDQQSFAWAVAKHLGADAIVHQSDQVGRAQSWTSQGTPVTYADVAQHLSQLGYSSSDPKDYQYKVKTVFRVDADQHYMAVPVPASAAPLGRLVMIPRPAEVSGDLRGGVEPDLTDLQYHALRAFSQAFAGGEKMVIINDFCQSPHWGNVGHTSIGFPGSALEDLHAAGLVYIIPATHRDYGTSLGRGPDGFLTPDFLQWHFSMTARALALGYSVPDAVIGAHQCRFEAVLRNQAGTDPFLISTALDNLKLDQIRWPGEPVDPARVEDLKQAIDASNLTHDAQFVLDASGTLICTQGADLLEAVRLTGYCLAVETRMADEHGHVVTCEMMSEILSAQRQMAYPDPTPY
jgi:hypothetical protein